MASTWKNQPQDAEGAMPRILIVDDSPAQRHTLRQLVERAGHEALLAESGEQALQLAAEEHPAVILMDIIMPGMSGYQVTRRLGRKDSTRDIPVIFVTGRDGEADRQWGLRQGAREYVTKPVDPEHLLTAIEKATAA
jgi:twitching motility two-component system response regulator PilH